MFESIFIFTQKVKKRKNVNQILRIIPCCCHSGSFFCCSNPSLVVPAKQGIYLTLSYKTLQGVIPARFAEATARRAKAGIYLNLHAGSRPEFIPYRDMGPG